MDFASVDNVKSNNFAVKDAFSEDTPLSIFNRATFMPFDEPSNSDMLLEKVWRFRQSLLLGLVLKISTTYPELYTATEFSDSFQKFLGLPSQIRRQISEYPPFRIWLQQSFQYEMNFSSKQIDSAKTKLKIKLAELERVIQEFYNSKSDVNLLKIPGTSIQVARYAVDPLIAEVTPPTYQFPDSRRQRELEEKTVYHLPFFLEVITVTLNRIKQTWPEAYLDFNKFVRMIIHVTDGTFRSCSAERYAGVIFLSADDHTLFDLEESLIHEYGHQILYNVMELDPLILKKTSDNFKLPWSGAERNFYGYFHAFYIYILLVCYFKRIHGRYKKEQKRVTERITDILKGLIKAIPDFEAADLFTPAGRELFETLKGKVYQLEKENKYL